MDVMDLDKVGQPVLVGYLPKTTEPKSDWIENAVVKEVCSVSDCVCTVPDCCRDKSGQNALGFYDCEQDAVACCGDEVGKYDIYAYRLFPLEFYDGEVSEYDVPLQVQADLDGYLFLGIDAVNRYASDFFECSALSCNNAARHYPVNRYCLFDDLDTAVPATQEISKGEYEPGRWFLLEVYRKNS